MKMRKVAIALFAVAVMFLGGCGMGLKTSIDFTKEEALSRVNFEGDNTAMPSSLSAEAAHLSSVYSYSYEHKHGLVVQHGSMFTNDAYKGDFRAELEVEIVYDDAGAQGFILGMGFKEEKLPGEDVCNIFKAVQFYGKHTGLVGSFQAYTVFEQMLYASVVSIEDKDIEYVLPYVAELMPGLVIGDGIIDGTNLIVVERIGGTIKVSVNGTLVGDYESEYLLDDYLVNALFRNYDTERPIRIGVFSACAHTAGDNEEGVFLKRLDVYADTIITH